MPPFSNLPLILCRMAFVEFDNVNDAKTALEKQNGSEVDGRQIRLEFSLPRYLGTGEFV